RVVWGCEFGRQRSRGFAGRAKGDRPEPHHRLEIPGEVRRLGVVAARLELRKVGVARPAEQPKLKLQLFFATRRERFEHAIVLIERRGHRDDRRQWRIRAAVKGRPCSARQKRAGGGDVEVGGGYALAQQAVAVLLLGSRQFFRHRREHLV